MAFKLLHAAQGHWRTLDRADLVTLVRGGVVFKDGQRVEPQPARPARKSKRAVA
jgi:hypothetical protein